MVLLERAAAAAIAMAVTAVAAVALELGLDALAAVETAAAAAPTLPAGMGGIRIRWSQGHSYHWAGSRNA